MSTLTVPQCHSYDDLISLNVFDMLHTLGPKLHTDPLLLCKVIRIGKAYFKETFSHCSPGDGGGGLKYELLQKVQ